MAETNPSAPAYPHDAYTANAGLTKRELFCLHCMVPMTGNEALDTIIREGRRFRIKEAAVAGLSADTDLSEEQVAACAKRVMNELEK